MGVVLLGRKVGKRAGHIDDFNNKKIILTMKRKLRKKLNKHMALSSFASKFLNGGGGGK